MSYIVDEEDSELLGTSLEDVVRHNETVRKQQDEWSKLIKKG